MSKIIFNEHQLRLLEANPNVASVSERAIQYTAEFKIRAVKEMGLVQSMSRRGNCLDNAQMESFFGHLKDEVNYKEAANLDELKRMIERYIDYYNTDRKQWMLKKNAPENYRSHLIAV